MKDGHLYYELPQMKHDPYNLKGSALRVYAALYILTAKHPFTGSYRTLADWIEDICPKTVKRAVDYLVDRNLVSRDIVTNTKKPIDGIYNLDALILPDAPLPRVRYKVIMNEYQKKENNLERKMEDYRREKIVEGVGQNVQGVGQNVQVLKESNKENNTYKIYNRNIYNNKKNNTMCVVKKEDGQAVTHTNKIVKTYHFEPYPTTEEEVIQFAQENYPTISIEVVKDFFNHYNGNGWRYSKNGRVRNWKSELFAYDQRRMKFEKANAAKAMARVQSGVSPEVLAIEEQMREQRRREREQADREGNSAEDKAAAEAFFARFKVK